MNSNRLIILPLFLYLYLKLFIVKGIVFNKKYKVNLLPQYFLNKYKILGIGLGMKRFSPRKPSQWPKTLNPPVGALE